MAEPLISLDGVSFSYGFGSAAAVLSNVSFDNDEGEFFCLLGPSGCGKTTVLRLIAGFDRPTAGTITVAGRRVSGAGIDRGVVFQGDDSLFTWLTALQNVTFSARMRGVPRKQRFEQAQHYLQMVGLTRHANKYPVELSGGMRQRIQIARVLANDPRILLMDEPFGALDAQTRNELQDELMRIWSATRKTVVFITHDISEAILLGDRIGVMRAGPGAGIREIIDVDLSRPRSRSSVKFGELYNAINQLITEEVVAARMAESAV